MYLDEHGLRLSATAEDVDRTFRALAAGRMPEADFARWVGGWVERV